MASADQETPEIVRAALALEQDIAKLEGLPRSLRKLRLNSEKTIAKAAKELSDALALPEQLSEGLRALATAMARLQVRQEAALVPLAAFANEVQARMQKLNQHMQAYGSLGTAAAEVTTLLQSDPEDRSAMMVSVDTRLNQIGEGARALFEAARADDFPDLAREADVLKQRVAALRKRLDGMA